MYVCIPVMYVCMHTSNSYGYSQLIITNLDHYEKKVLFVFFFNKYVLAIFKRKQLPFLVLTLSIHSNSLHSKNLCF